MPRRTAAALLLLILLAALCASCASGKEKSCAGIIGELAGGEEDDAYLFVRGNGKYGIDEPELFARLYAAKGTPDPFSAVSDFAVLISKKEGGREIHILRVKHSSEIPRVYDMLYDRLRMLQSAQVVRYCLEDYDRFFASAEICVISDLVCLFCTSDNDGAAAAVKELAH